MPSQAPSAARVLTVFHDLPACAFNEEDPDHNMQSLFQSIDVAANGSLGRPAKCLALEWRCVMPMQYPLPPVLAEHFVDLGISNIFAGRKPEAVAQKIRSDIGHFIESHSAVHDHAVVLAVADPTLFAFELERLNRAGIHSFIVSASGYAPALRSASCRSLGCWNDVIASSRPSTAAAGAAPSAPATTAGTAGSEWSEWSRNMPDTAALAAAALQAATAPASPFTAPDNNDENKTDKRVIINQAVNVGAASWMWQPPAPAGEISRADMPLPTSHHLRSTGASASTAETKGDDHDHYNGSTGRYSPRIWRSSRVAAAAAAGGSSVQKVARGPYTTPGSAGIACNARWTRDPAATSSNAGRSAPSTSVPASAATTAAEPAAGSDTNTSSNAAFDPYRIIFGTLHRYTEALFCIVERDTLASHEIAAGNLDFDYCWAKQLPLAAGAGAAGAPAPAGQVICCRLHKSGRVTDIRMCGHVARIVRGEFGFIKHQLFPDNLYFRLTDVDPTAGCDGTITEGSIVAFRVGRKGERKWAMRVWKTPDGAVEQPAAATIVPAAGSNYSSTLSSTFTSPTRGALYANGSRGANGSKYNKFKYSNSTITTNNIKRHAGFRRQHHTAASRCSA